MRMMRMMRMRRKEEGGKEGGKEEGKEREKGRKEEAWSGKRTPSNKKIYSHISYYVLCTSIKICK